MRCTPAPGWSWTVFILAAVSVSLSAHITWSRDLFSVCTARHVDDGYDKDDGSDTDDVYTHGPVVVVNSVLAANIF